MPVIFIDKEETIGSGRTKTNQLSANVGDLALLETPVTTDVVSAINSLNTAVSAQEKKLLLFALAVSE